MVQILQENKMHKLFFSFINSTYAGPGEGHAHGPMGDSGTQILGVVIIIAIAGIVFWAMNKKK